MAVLATQEETDHLLALIFGVLHEDDIVGGAPYAAKLAICARMTNGNQEAYGRAVKRAIVMQELLLNLFDQSETQGVVQQFLRAIRKARRDPETMQWLREQFPQPQESDTVKTYLVTVERELANAFIGRH